MKITQTRAKPIVEVNERMPAWLDTLVNQLMEPDLSRRIETAEDTVTLIRDAHAHVRNPSAHKLPSTLSHDVRWRNIDLLLAGICLFLFVAGISTWGLSTTTPTLKTPIQRTVPPSPVSVQAVQSLPEDTNLDSAMDWNASEIPAELKSIEFVLDELTRQLGEPKSPLRDNALEPGDQR